jgi:Ca-activated chloride channel homolog
MARPGLLALATVLAALVLRDALAFSQQPPVATFKSGVDLVRVTAVVRDQKGRFVNDLIASDFEVLDGTDPRPILEFRHDSDGLSIALLFDVSGSMEGRLPDAREAANHVLSWLDVDRDETAIFSFDTRLDELLPFTRGLKTLPGGMSKVTAFGATSLHDAIAQTAERAGLHDGRRRAVVVLTDGRDNASRLQPDQAAALASAIDVPIYIFGIVASIDNPSEDIAATSAAGRSSLVGPLDDLAAATGGRTFISSGPGQRSVAARQMVDELRHQYFIAFESSHKPGWHALMVRVRKKNLNVRARNGYNVGQYRPNAF